MHRGLSTGLIAWAVGIGLGSPIAWAQVEPDAKGTEGAAATEETKVSPEEIRRRLLEINRRRLKLNQYGMGALSTWAIGNIVVGVIGNVTADDADTQSFHQGNWAWNTVNLVIGGIGLYNALTADPSELGYLESLGASEGAEMLFLINGILDHVYMAAGAWLWERGLRTDEPRMKGWGQALVLQGGFLLVFDAVMWALTRTVTADIKELPVKLVPMVGGASLAIRF